MSESFPKPRNLEEDKKSFLEAVENTSIEEVQVNFDEESQQRLSRNIEETKIFLLGETHGVKENVDVIYTLFKKFGFRILALEWERSLMGVINKYIESGDLDFEEIKDSPDGRITAGHFALLKKMHNEGLLEELVCFDSGTSGLGWDNRDKNMAHTILDSQTDTPMLVVAGNLHTKTKPITFSGESDEYHPMGENIKNKIPEVTSGKISYLSGQYHNYGTKDFIDSVKEEASDPKFYLADDGSYIFELVNVQSAVVPNPQKIL